MADDPDDGRVWGWVLHGAFRPLPHWPGWNGRPPCDVTLPSGEVRRLIWQDDFQPRSDEPASG